MSYWILAVLVASSIVVFEGSVAWWIVPLFIIVVAWKRGQENWKRVLGIVLCVAIGMRLFLYIREVTHPSFMVDDAIHGQLVLNPNQLKVNGDLEPELPRWKQERSTRKSFSITLSSRNLSNKPSCSCMK